MPDLTLKGQFTHARELIQAGSIDEGLAVCQNMLTAFPQYYEVYNLLGQALLKKGLYSQAQAWYERTLSVDPEHASACVGMAVIREANGAQKEAQAWLTLAWELLPERALVSGMLDEYDKKSALNIPCQMTGAGLARTYARGRLYRNAEQEFRRALAREPLRPDLRVALAEVARRLGDTDTASTVCEALLIELPNCLKALLILGQIGVGHEQDGEQDREARALLRWAQRLDPDNLIAQQLFGAVSPLPPRVARLPALEMDDLFPEPEYLSGSEEDII